MISEEEELLDDGGAPAAVAEAASAKKVIPATSLPTKYSALLAVAKKEGVSLKRPSLRRRPWPFAHTGSRCTSCNARGLRRRRCQHLHRNPAMRSPAYDEEEKSAKKMNTREGLKGEEKIRRGGEGLWKRKRRIRGELG